MTGFQPSQPGKAAKAEFERAGLNAFENHDFNVTIMDDGEDSEDAFRIPDLLSPSLFLHDVDPPPKFPFSEPNYDGKRPVFNFGCLLTLQ